MNLDFTADQQELRDQARKLLEARNAMGLDRAVLERGTAFSEKLWKEVGALGWLGVSIPDAQGGLGLGAVFQCGLAEEFGRVLAPLPLESSIFAAAEALKIAGTDAQKQTWLPMIADGRAVGVLAIAEGAGAFLSGRWTSKVRQGRLSGTKVPVGDGAAAHVAIVAASGESGPQLWLADLAQTGVRRERLDSIDPTRPLSRLVFEDVPVEPMGQTSNAQEIVRRIAERASVSTAFLQLGGAQRALEITRDWAQQRQAFGRPIGGFQAVKHRLADLFAKIEIARSNAYYAAWALENDAPDLPLAAAVARVAATTAFEHAARDMIHLHGALGVTWESDCQLFYRRSRHLALVFGAADEWRERIMKELETRNAA